MNSIRIYGNKELRGEVTVQGSKNAALPILAACILIKGTCQIQNCPNITDVQCMIRLLESVGCKTTRKNDTITVDAREITSCRLPSEYVTKMRSSVILMGALLKRTGNACLDYPGGCVIGKRPIDIHVMGFQKLGVDIVEEENSLLGEVAELKGCEIVLPFPSVGATENIVLAAVLATGNTSLHNYAKEPEVKAMCDFLNKAGAKIKGFGEPVLRIEGCKELKPIVFQVPSDRVVAGTYLLGCQAAGGDIVLHNTPIESMKALFLLLEKMGSKLEKNDGSVRLTVCKRSEAIPFVRTEVYPGFPTDLQSQLMVVFALANGKSVLEENIFESRFKIAAALNAMGADIMIKGNKAYITGRDKLFGRQMMAEELRGGAALVLAGLCAEGITVVGNRHFIDRGYVDICGDLKCLGAQVSGD